MENQNIETIVEKPKRKYTKRATNDLGGIKTKIKKAEKNVETLKAKLAAAEAELADLKKKAEEMDYTNIEKLAKEKNIPASILEDFIKSYQA